MMCCQVVGPRVDLKVKSSLTSQAVTRGGLIQLTSGTTVGIQHGYGEPSKDSFGEKGQMVTCLTPWFQGSEKLCATHNAQK